MDKQTLQLMDDAFFNGSYSLVFDLSSNAIMNCSDDNIAYLYRALSEIGMTEFSVLNAANAGASISFAFRHLYPQNSEVE